MNDGILIIDKPEGITSHDVVARLRRILKTKRIGHTGTLDPFATGVLVMLIGRATRLAQFLDKDIKEYEAVVRLGFETDMGDRTGQPKAEHQTPEIGKRLLKSLSFDKIEEVLTKFRGDIQQTPPMYSAKKIKGIKLYEMARKGIEVERQPVEVKIYELKILRHELRENPVNESGLLSADFNIKVACSAGTYIRTLAEDIGKKLETGAHLAELRRTKAGSFDVIKAVTLEQLERYVSENKVSQVMISMSDALAHLPQRELSAEEVIKTRNGLTTPHEIDNCRAGQAVKMINEVGDLIAVGVYDELRKQIQPRVVMM